jgi:hypothetical protein
MVLAIAFLLLVSLVITAILATLGGFIGTSGVLWQALNLIVGLARIIHESDRRRPSSAAAPKAGPCATGRC